MNAGFDVTPNTYAKCLFKRWDNNSGCAMALSITGTGMEVDALCDAIPVAADLTEATLVTCAEKIQESGGAQDIMFAATNITTACMDLHKRIWEIREFAGQGIYVGGAILYYTPEFYFLLPFGGCRVYAYTGEKLVTVGTEPDSLFIQDAIGGSSVWKPHPYKVKRTDNVRLLLTTGPIPDLAAAEKLLMENTGENPHPNTVAILIRKMLNAVFPEAPHGVIDITF